MNAVLQTPPSRPIRIGELAARTGRSVHAIRWYESQGLIPGVMRDAGGRRVYRERHLTWLELIDRLRLTGMSIAQMREYATLVKEGRETLPSQQVLLRAHRERVQANIEQWTLALHHLDHKIELLDQWIRTGVRPVASPPPPVDVVGAPARQVARPLKAVKA